MKAGAHPPDDPLAQLAVAPLFVVGHPRSGTTWVYEILAAHPEATGVLESYLFSRNLGVGAMLDEDLWDPAKTTTQEGERTRLGQICSREEFVGEVRRFVGRVLGLLLEPHHRFVVEKTPLPWMRIELAAEVFPDARFVHVLRDGRDVAVSMRAGAESWNPGWGEFAASGFPPRAWRGAYRVGCSWRDVISSARAVAGDTARSYLEVRYEEIKSRPHDEFRRLFDFCRMPYDDTLLERVHEATDFERRFEGGEDRGRRAGRVGDWRERFGLLDAAAFELGSRGMLGELGYERTRAWWARRGARLRNG